MSQTTLPTTSLSLPLVALQIRRAGSKPRLMIVKHDGFQIGAAEQCDLCLPQLGLPKFHSVLHVQGTAVWIEAVDDDALISLDGEAFRRRALRDGDELSFGELTIAVHIGEQSVQAARPISQPHFSLDDRLSRLTAEELCDLIELEEMQTEQYDRRRQLGMKALMSAVQDVVDTDVLGSESDAVPQLAAIADDRFDELVAQIRDLSDTLDERTRELSAQETLLLESSAQMTEAQRRVNRQLEQLLERLSPDEDMRVSA